MSIIQGKLGGKICEIFVIYPVSIYNKKPMIYAYGDSFTYGTGIRDNTTLRGKVFPAYINSSTWSDLTWIKELKRLTGSKIKNNGVGGVSNDFIIYRVLKEMMYFTKDDIVIIGGTKHMRMMVPAGEGGPDDSILLPITHDVKEWKWKDGGKGMYSFDGWKVSKDQINALIQYYYEVFPKYERYYEKLHEEQYLGLSQYLNKTGVTCIYWDSSAWLEFEQIYNWTNNQNSDGHWSPNGHLHFARVIKFCLDNNVRRLDKNRLLQIKEYVPMDFPYIEYTNLI